MMLSNTAVRTPKTPSVIATASQCRLRTSPRGILSAPSTATTALTTMRPLANPTYVTALGESNAPNGWRANKPHGGCLMEVTSGDVVCRGLSMPHSPRWHDGRLWLLESGTGQLLMIDPVTGQREPLSDLPGFARGLALCGQYAFVGLSRIRATSAMDGAPLAARRDELKCGVVVVDLAAPPSGRVCGMLEFQTAVEEIFDVQLLRGFQFPEVIGFHKDTLHHTFIVPEQVGDPWRVGARFNDSIIRRAVAS